MIRLPFLILFILPLFVKAQHQYHTSDDSLKQEILKIRNELEQVELNLSLSESKFKRGILVATIGYSTVITGGLMLGRKQDTLGKGLLIAGGATGVIGTVLMLDAFKYLGRPFKKKQAARTY
jgi:hypothetical protein